MDAIDLQAQMVFGGLALLIGYLCGSVPFGLILTRMAGYGDIRQIGSGNIGATNVLRTGNKLLALRTLLLDAAKGFFAVYLLHWFSLPEDADMRILGACAGVGAVVGHVCPVWLKFRGGKGVATALGVFFTVTPWIGMAALGIWLGTAFLFHYSSLAALVALGAAPVLAGVFYGVKLAGLYAGIAGLVWVRHAANIRRLIKGEEPKISLKSSRSASGPEAAKEKTTEDGCKGCDHDSSASAL